MDQARARALLAAERARLRRLLQADIGEPQAAELGDAVDDDEPAPEPSLGIHVERDDRTSSRVHRTAVRPDVLPGHVRP
jgi:hypothetical protein